MAQNSRNIVESMPTIYALDIETDTSPAPFVYPDGTITELPAGLDPRVSNITSFGFAGSDGTRIVADTQSGHTEAMMIGMIKECLHHIADRHSILVTWNGTGFDLPFIAVRTDGISMLPFDPETDTEPKYGWPEWAKEVSVERQPTGQEGWGSDLTIAGKTVRHVDLVDIYREWAAYLGIRCGLKQVYRTVTGKEPIEVDRTQMHLLTAEERLAYVLSDAEATLALAERNHVNVALRSGVLVDRLIDQGESDDGG